MLGTDVTRPRHKILIAVRRVSCYSRGKTSHILMLHLKRNDEVLAHSDGGWERVVMRTMAMKLGQVLSFITAPHQGLSEVLVKTILLEALLRPSKKRFTIQRK